RAVFERQALALGEMERHVSQPHRVGRLDALGRGVDAVNRRPGKAVAQDLLGRADAAPEVENAERRARAGRGELARQSVDAELDEVLERLAGQGGAAIDDRLVVLDVRVELRGHRAPSLASTAAPRDA